VADGFMKGRIPINIPRKFFINALIHYALVSYFKKASEREKNVILKAI
jgi:hypothetical protein